MPISILRTALCLGPRSQLPSLRPIFRGTTLQLAGARSYATGRSSNSKGGNDMPWLLPAVGITIGGLALVYTTAPAKTARHDEQSDSGEHSSDAEDLKNKQISEQQGQKASRDSKDGGQEIEEKEEENDAEVNKPEEDVENSQTDIKRVHKPGAPKRVDGAQGE